MAPNEHSLPTKDLISSIVLWKQSPNVLKLRNTKRRHIGPNWTSQSSVHITFFGEYLKQIVDDKNWDEYLKLASFSYNTSVHEGTRYTPHELVFGKIARVPSSEPTLEDMCNESYMDIYLISI